MPAPARALSDFLTWRRRELRAPGVEERLDASDEICGWDARGGLNHREVELRVGIEARCGIPRPVLLAGPDAVSVDRLLAEPNVVAVVQLSVLQVRGVQ